MCECGRTFPDTFKNCPKCGSNNPDYRFLGIKHSHWYVTVGIIILGILNFIVYLDLNTLSPKEIAALEAAEKKRVLENIERHQNTIQICENMNYRETKREYIDRASESGDTIWVKEAWHALPADNKRSLARDYATCVSISKETTIRDAKTNRELAQYSVREGYTDHPN